MVEWNLQSHRENTHIYLIEMIKKRKWKFGVHTSQSGAYIDSRSSPPRCYGSLSLSLSLSRLMYFNIINDGTSYSKVRNCTS